MGLGLSVTDRVGKSESIEKQTCTLLVLHLNLVDVQKYEQQNLRLIKSIKSKSTKLRTTFGDLY